MNWRSFFSGILGGLLVVATLSVPGIRSQSPTTLNVAGTVMMVASGSCPAYYSELTSLNGKMPLGTLAANGDIGTTGGSDSITPTIATLTAAAQTFTGSSASTSAVSAGTPVGTNSTVTGPAQVISWPVGVPTFSGSSGTVPAQTFTGSSATTSAVSAGTPAGTNSVPTFTGSALATHQHELPFHSLTSTSISWISSATFGTGTSRAAIAVDGGNTSNTTSAAVAKDQPVSAGTPAGTVTAPTFTGSALSTHTHTLTATGTNGTVSFTPSGTVAWPAGVPTNATSTIPAETFTGSALGTHSHTLTATGTNGTSSVTGTLNSFDNRSAFVKVIFCIKS